ncbi:hypothetical protein BDV98DRAFT_575868 [Pterulicium gracile]|uniref:ATP-grasp domain-containing protein n=1 Tax=Pterulicium gracile TaxID=1884261 RepID=A0A5C3Q3K3_9AGAR|nr:hypothetical protein BDV98DRAFT_575868 [Pterula gracilis]
MSSAAPPRKRVPTTIQSVFTSALIIILSLVLLPVTLFLLLIPALVFSRVLPLLPPGLRPNYHKLATQLTRPKASEFTGHRRPTVLINNGRTSKALFLARSLYAAGARVVLIDESPLSGTGGQLSLAKILTTDYSALVSQTRASCAVDKSYFVTVPGPSREARIRYVQEIVAIAQKEDADIWFPCSGVGSTGDDARVGEILDRVLGHTRRKGRPQFRSIIQDEELARTLHEKDLFMDLLSSISLPHPYTRIVKSVDEAIDVIRNFLHANSSADLEAPNAPRLIIKATVVLDDLGRADMTTYPLEEDLLVPCFPAYSSPNTGTQETGAKDACLIWAELPLLATRRKLEGLGLPISPDCPYIVQELIAFAPVPLSPLASKRNSPLTQIKSLPTTSSPELGAKSKHESLESDELYYLTFPDLPKETCTYATVFDGSLIAFVVCPSNDMLLTYTSITDTPLGRMMETYTEFLLDRLGKTRKGGRQGLTGQFSLDFMLRSPPLDQLRKNDSSKTNEQQNDHDEHGNKEEKPREFQVFLPNVFKADLVCIECNPRVHTAIVLLGREGGRKMAEELLRGTGWIATIPSSANGVISNTTTCIKPSPTTPSRSWIGHDLVVRFPTLFLDSPSHLLRPLANTLRRLMALVHPLWGGPIQYLINKSYPLNELIEPTQRPAQPWNDPSWAWDDPMPFFVLYHVQWVAVMVSCVAGISVGLVGVVGNGVESVADVVGFVRNVLRAVARCLGAEVERDNGKETEGSKGAMKKAGGPVKGRWSRLNVSTGRVFAC